jgi:hypothetical protein
MIHPTRDVAGLVAHDKTGEYYVHETKLIFDNNTGSSDRMNFTFRWEVIDGFDESAVAFDKPGVSYEVGDTEKGWRRLTITCEGLDVSEGLTAKLRYPAHMISVRDTAPGYYKWDLDAHTEEDIPELNNAMDSFETPYACANWIRQNIVYENFNSDPQTAAETFREGKGDCDDVAILFCYMVKRLFPEMEPRVVEGWTVDGAYHANVTVRTDEGWLMLDPSMSSVRFGVFDFEPFVPSGRVSHPSHITAVNGSASYDGGIEISFAGGSVAKV